MKAAPLSDTEVQQRLQALPGWSAQGGAIEKAFAFPDYHRTIAFVNAVAWIAHRADHHPELAVGYNRCTVRYSTHSAGGITAKDFESAARVDALLSS